MEKEQKILNIYQRLNRVMGDVQGIQKEDKKVNGQYTFVSHDAVSGALHGPMVKHGIVMIPTVAEIAQDGNRTVIKMEIAFVNVDDSADRVVVNYPGYGIDPSDKGIGKAISYAVKYALLKVFCLETGDDIEKHDMEYKAPEKEVVEPTQDKLIGLFLEHDRVKVPTYIEHLSDKFNKTKEDILKQAFRRLDDFKEGFDRWKTVKA